MTKGLKLTYFPRGFPEQLIELYKKCIKGRQTPSTQELFPILSTITRHLEDLFVVIDALDEFAKLEERQDLLVTIEEIHSWSLPNVHLLVTSRPESDIEVKLALLANPKPISIQGSQVDSHINLHIKAQLAKDTKLQKLPNEVKAEIEETLSTKANGMQD